MKILNLGCGSKTSAHPYVVNIDWSITLRLKKNKFLSTTIAPLLDHERKARFEGIPTNIIVHDISAGIPFSDNSVDVVYHSHVLEHLDRSIAQEFVHEVRRVLKPGGVHRIVVPDFEKVCRQYLSHYEECCVNQEKAFSHDEFIAKILEQSVRKESHGTSRQSPIRRFFENVILGDARRRGETHQWMYDKFNLMQLLVTTGYREVCVRTFDTSSIPDWNKIGLDVDDDGNQYKCDSLYVEAIK